jgi:hypothetical protein
MISSFEVRTYSTTTLGKAQGYGLARFPAQLLGHVHDIELRILFRHSNANFVGTVTRLLPPLDVELQYRIKSETEAHERVAVEQELRAVEVSEMSGGNLWRA